MNFFHLKMTESEHLSDILSEISPIVTDTLNYELRIRGIQPAQAPSVKKVQLARELFKEKQGNGCTQWPFMPISEDLRSIASLFAFFDVTLNGATRTNESIENALINLAFLKIRIERINPKTQPDENTAAMINANIDNAITKGKRLLKNLTEREVVQEEAIDLASNENPISNSTDNIGLFPLFASMSLNNANENQEAAPNTNPFESANTQQQSHTNDYAFGTQSHFNQSVPFSSTNSPPNTNHVNWNTNQNFKQSETLPNAYEIPNTSSSRRNSLTHSNSMPQSANYAAQQMLRNPNDRNSCAQPATRRDHKLYKWRVTFSGDSQKYDAIDFIQKVNALAQARGVSDPELFDSAIDLFTGPALKWYYAQRSQVGSWSELSEKLISDFIEVNYYDNLLDTIRQRRQHSSDSIVQFFTIFEDDCSRLQKLLTSAEKIHIIKKNILQKYRPYVTLKNYNSLNELKYDLKLLEASMNANDRTVGFTNNSTTHSSRYDSFRRNRSQSRSPSNSGNFSHQNHSSTSNIPNRSGTPVPNERKHNNSYDRSEKRNQSPYTQKRDESHDRNKNPNRNISGDRNASQRFKSPSNLNR